MRKKLISGIILYAMSIVLLVLPIIILFIIRKDVYFVDGNETDITMGGILGMGYALLLVSGAFKDIDKRFSTLIGMCIMLGVVWFLEAIMSDMFWVVLCGIIGYVLYIGLSTWGKYYINYARGYNNERARVDARKDARKDYEGLGNV